MGRSGNGTKWIWDEMRLDELVLDEMGLDEVAVPPLDGKHLFKTIQPKCITGG